MFSPRLLLLSLVLLLCACESATDLSPFGVQAKIDLPEGVVAQKASIGQGVLLSNGKDFALKIVPQGLNLRLYKQQVSNNALNQLKKIHQETADVLLYESELAGNQEFHFVANQKVGNTVYLCREDVVARRFSMAEIEKMLAICQQMAAK